jgi:hypothetical protein
MANSSKRQRRLWDAYAVPGFRPQTVVRAVFGDPKARVVTLVRRSKKLSAAAVVACTRAGTIGACGMFAGWARRFFENWRASLKWQRLKPYEKFAGMIDRHWDGIAAYCRPENKVPLGFVEGLNNKIRVIQRRAYGLRDEEYLRLKILTCMLPAL